MLPTSPFEIIERRREKDSYRMANYGYGYSTYTSQPQQYSTGSYATQNTGSYGYASTQQATRVVQGYQTGATAYGTTGYAQTPVQAVAAPSSGGYGYFQRASDQGSAYNQKQTSYNSSTGYGYSGTSQKTNSGYTVSSGYQKPQQYNSSSSSYNSGYSAQRLATSQNYNNSSFAKQKQTTTSTKTTGSSHQNSYDKVVYNAATSFLSQQAQSSKPTWKNDKPQFKLQNQKNKTSQPKPQQLHYCEVCKISCAGPQTYKEHLDGQKHKKRAAQVSVDAKTLPSGSYKCELCDVVCTGRDAFNAHLKGINHTKTVKLHQKLGKPVPEVKLPEEPPAKKANIVKTTPLKTNFVGGTRLTSTGTEESATDEGGEGEAAADGDPGPEVEPIGEEYVEEVKSDNGKVIGFKCTLCDCRFNDLIARMAHVKGRRHRLSYKKKVDPKIRVDLKVKGSRKGLGDNRSQEIVWKQRQQEQLRWEQELRQREQDLQRWENEEYRRRASEDRYWTRPDRSRMQELDYYEWERREYYGEPVAGYIPPQGPPPPTPDDRLVMMKHAEIYPSENELKQVQTTVAAVEKALKLVSDTVGDKEGTNESEANSIEVKKEEVKPEEKTDESKIANANKAESKNRILKGVMRVGPLCTGLLLKGQLAVELVVLCADKPTYTLLTRVGKLVPEKLKEAAPDEKFNMAISMSECCITISTSTEPKCSVKVTLTSPAVRGEEDDGTEKPQDSVKKEPVDEKDVLDKEKTLEALAALRHAKWFQARANQLTSCVITIRIMREMRSRVPEFNCLSDWAVELLCEKSLGSGFHPLAPGEAFRRVLEAVSSGIFLPGGVGLLDPCEKEKVDAAAHLSAQQREEITAAAMHALRLVAFRQLHKVLDLEPLKPGSRKRRAEPNSDQPDDEAKVAKKE